MENDRIRRRIGILLDEADEAFARRDWEIVQQRSNDALALDPENQEALTYLAGAERALSTTTNTAPSPPRTDAPTTGLPATPAPTPEAERRQLTVMFCDLQGSTALSQQLDPEELRDVIRSYQEVCAGAVSGFEGHIAKYLGDGLLIYFGYPQAHEDDPQRAVRAGLAILENMHGLNTRLKAENDLELAVRIGVHTGLVVAGEMGAGENVEELAIVGETPNIAARLQEAAEPNSLVVSDITGNLIQGFFVCEALGPHDLKGISESMELLKVISETGAQTRFDVAAAAQLTPLVGREQELGLLLDRWEQAKEGLGQVVLLSGEAGIGKSRLIEALTQRLAEGGHIHRRIRCSAYHQTSALHPVSEYLESRLGFNPGDSPEKKLSKVEKGLAGIDFPLTEAVPLLAGLLSLQLNERFPQLTLSPEVQRSRTLELLLSIMLDSRDDQPVFIVVEDLHWADPSTLAALNLLLDRAPTARVLVLLTFRPEFTPPWGSRAHVTQVMLNRLTRKLAGDMVGGLTGGRTLPEDVLSQIVAKSDGVPLFVEELIRMVLESDLVKIVDDQYELTGPLPPLAIPSNLQDSLTARLDRLSEAREVAQLGAVLGREFAYEIIEDVSPLDEETLRRHLQRLVDNEFLFQRGLPPNSIYTFKHALIQDAAYGSLLKSRRQQYHQTAARSLEARFPETVANRPEMVAHHYAEGGLAEQAVSYWLLAGKRALAAYAHEEALGHFERGLAARNITVSESMVAPDEEAAELLFGLGQAQRATLPRHLLSEVGKTIKPAFDYYSLVGDIPLAMAITDYIGAQSVRGPISAEILSDALKLVPEGSRQFGQILSSFADVLASRANGAAAATDALDQALEIARREDDAVLEIQVSVKLSSLHFGQMEYQQSLDRCLRAIELIPSVVQPPDTPVYWYAVRSLIALGRAEDARPYAARQLELAEESRSRFRLAQALHAIGYLAYRAGNWETAREYSVRCLEIDDRDIRLLNWLSDFENGIGNFAAGARYIDRILETISDSPPGTVQLDHRVVPLTIGVAARITGQTGRFELAASVAELVSSSISESRQTNIGDFTRTGLALMAVQTGDVSAAKEHYSILKPMPISRTPLDLIDGNRVLGLLAQTIGDLASAVDHFEGALEFCRKAGYRPEVAWTCWDYADVLRQRDNEGDRVKAISLLDEALAISSELAMEPLIDRVLSRQEMLKT